MSVDFLQMGRRRNSMVSAKPCWLRSSIDELDKKMQEASLEPAEGTGGDSFAERAELYYRKRPQMLNLLHDVYRQYISLADRYSHLRSQPDLPSMTSGAPEAPSDGYDSSSGSAITADVETPMSTCSNHEGSGEEGVDAVVVEAVGSRVELELMRHELECKRLAGRDSGRKIELQRSLLEVLESERLILFGENARLSYRVAALTEENKELVGDVVFLKRKVAELSRCLLKMRDDHRVCVLSRRVEDLQAHVYVLEERNLESMGRIATPGSGGNGGFSRSEMERLLLENFHLKETLGSREPSVASTSSSTISRWVEKAKRVRFFACGFSSSSRCGEPEGSWSLDLGRSGLG